MEDKDANGLAIGGFESGFCAKMCATFVFDMLESEFGESIFQGVYHDDGMIVFKGQRNCRDIEKWLERFQIKVNKLV
eukprot:12331315-Ditylum_brightwellii.AAC.1